MTEKQSSVYGVCGVERLAQEIFRQAVYDWSDPDYRKEVKAFFVSEWAEELAALHGVNPDDALHRLETGAISDPSEFYAGAGPSLDHYTTTKNSRSANPLLLESLFARH